MKSEKNAVSSYNKDSLRQKDRHNLDALKNKGLHKCLGLDMFEDKLVSENVPIWAYIRN